MKVKNKSISKKQKMKRYTRSIEPIKINKPKRTLKSKEPNTKRQLIRKIKQTNRRLKKLSAYTGKEDSWAVKKLSERLSTYGLNAYKRGQIKMKKNPSKFELRAIGQAIDLFEKSKTSTIKGIKSVERKQIENIRKRLSIPGDEITKEDARFLFNAMSDELFNEIKGGYSPSEMQAIVMRAREEKQSKNELLEIMSNVNNYSNDSDINKKFNLFYNKYVRA